MKAVSISEAKNTLSALIRYLRGGGTVVITDRGRPVAKLEEVDRHESNQGLNGLIRSGIVSPGSGAAPTSIWESDPPGLNQPVSVVAILLEERTSGR